MSRQKYKALYYTEVITGNKTIKPDGSSVMYFENIGTDNCTINGLIPLNNNGVGRVFEEREFVVIDSDFLLEFEGSSADKKVLLVKTKYSEI